MGQITGTPTVRARTTMFYPAAFTSGAFPEVRQYWGVWSDLVQAVVQSFPIIEIASIIGVGGLALGVANNFLSGRREKQMTEVTRSAAEDERFMELYNASRDVSFQETLSEVLYQYEWTDYDDFLAKYGPRTNITAWAKIQSVSQYFEGIGVFVEEGSVDIGRVHRLLSTQIIQSWEKLDSVIYEQRKQQLDASVYNSFESLYFAIKMYQQQGPPLKNDISVHKFDD